MSVAKQTINAYIQVRLNDLEYKEVNEYSAVGLDNSGVYIADAQGNYVQSATNVKGAIRALDLQLYSVATTYAPMAATASTFTGILGTPSEVLNTLKKIGDSINNEASFASNFLSTIGGEIATATAAENKLRTDLSGEVIRSIPVENLLRSDLSGQIVFASAADAQLTTDLSGELVRVFAAEADLLVAISDNITARVQAVNDLSSSIDTRLVDLSGTFYTGIANEVIRATTADNQIITDLSGEIQRSVTEDISYRTDLSGEILRASTADAQLNTDLTGEVQRATAADDALAGRVSTIEEYYIPKDPLTKAATANFDLSGNKIVGLGAPSADGDATNKKYVDDSVSALGAVFSYRGVVDISEGDFENLAPAPTWPPTYNNDLTLLEHQEVGSVYKITGNAVVFDRHIWQFWVFNVSAAYWIDSYQQLLYEKYSNAIIVDIENHVALDINFPAEDSPHNGEIRYISNNPNTMDYVRVYDNAGELLASISPGQLYSFTYSSGSWTALNIPHKRVKSGDFVVKSSSGWDIFNNTNIFIENRSYVTGNPADGYTVDIESTYMGNNTITTVGTLTSGAWQATTLATGKGGSGQTTYAAGDLLLGDLSGSLQKLPLGAQGTFLKSDGANASWVPEDTANISLTSTTNFPTLATLQESLDSLYDSFQKRKIVQFVLQSSTDYADATTPNVNLLSGKVNFINYDAGNTTIYLPPSSTEVANGTIIRVVHNGDYSTSNMTIKYKDVDANTDVSVVEIAPHDTTAFVWNAASSSWLIGIGI